MSFKCTLLVAVAIFALASSWMVNLRQPMQRHSLQMGIADMFKNALANDPNLPAAENPGLSKERQMIEIEFLPAKKVVKAPPGQRLTVVAQAAGIDIKYKCKKGDCGTCTVNFDGIPTKVCQTSLPAVPTKARYVIKVPSK